MSAEKQPHAKFALGKVVATPGALAALPSPTIANALNRHSRGDWGDLTDEDREENEVSLREGFRILSAYVSDTGIRFWVITEADRSSTCILLPEEY